MASAEHEKLAVYHRSIELAGLLEAIASTIPGQREDLRDQLRRASASVPLNLAEGASEFSPAEKARFYRMARRSAAECSAILDTLDRTVGKDPRFDTAREQLRHVAAVLTKMVKQAEDRRR